MKDYIFMILLTLLGLVFSSEVKASHIMGGEITYEAVPGQGNFYLITLTLYRDCNGATLPNIEEVDVNLLGCMPNSIEVSLNLLPGFPEDVTPLCPDQESSCNNGNGTIGVQQYIYEGRVSLPVGCTNIEFSYGNCCRNNAITTLPNSSFFQITAELNCSQSSCNSSPVFQNLPVAYVCVGQQAMINPGAIDADGDNLVFSLVDCGLGAGQYISGFDGQNPLTTDVNGTILNPNTGALTFTPTATQVGVICILVEEFSNGVLVGSTVRDIQVTVSDCNNQAPIASAPNAACLPFGSPPAQYELSACVGDELCFEISFCDPETDNLTINWGQEIPDATFTPFADGTTSPTAEFCWAPQATDAGASFFTVTVQDDNCNSSGIAIPGISTFTYEINVSNPIVDIPNPEVEICAGETATFELDTNVDPANVASIEWVNLNDNTVEATGVYSFTTSPITSTNYQAVLTDINGCVATVDATVTVIQPNGTPFVGTEFTANITGQDLFIDHIVTVNPSVGNIVQILDCTFSFSENGGIVVPPGVVLLLTQSVLTRADICANTTLWMGVLARENSTVSLKTSTIEFAEIGVLHEPTITPTQNQGFTFSAFDSYFLNNTVSVLIQDVGITTVDPNNGLRCTIVNTEFFNDIIPSTDFVIVQNSNLEWMRISNNTFVSSDRAISLLNLSEPSVNVVIASNTITDINTWAIRVVNGDPITSALVADTPNYLIADSPNISAGSGILTQRLKTVEISNNNLSVRWEGIILRKIIQKNVSDNIITNTHPSRVATGLQLGNSLWAENFNNYGPSSILNNSVEGFFKGIDMVNYNTAVHSLVVDCNTLIDNSRGIRLSNAGITTALGQQGTPVHNTFSNNTTDLFLDASSSLVGYYYATCPTLCTDMEPLTFNTDAAGDILPVNGVNAVAINDADVCSSAFMPRQGSIMGIKGGNRNDLEVYPNPTSGGITINPNNNLIEEYTVSVFDVRGKKIIDAFAPNAQELNINLDTHPDGVYFVQIQINDIVSMKKIILERR